MQAVNSLISQHGVPVVVAAGALSPVGAALPTVSRDNTGTLMHLPFRLVLMSVSPFINAGNGRVSACTIVPANIPAAITVAATNLSTKFDNTTAASDAESL